MRDDSKDVRAVKMTREQADKIMREICSIQRNNVAALRAIDRKRSWSPAVKAMASADRRVRQETLSMLAALLGETFNLGGY